MVINEFPIGETLKGVSIVKDQEFGGNELCLDQIQLLFENTLITLLPISDTDEIEIIQKSPPHHYELNTPIWCQSFLNQKLMTVWVCENAQGYQDQIIFAFGNLHPSISFLSEGSVLKAFYFQHINQSIIENKTEYEPKLKILV
jgi:hypothetical protein